MHCGCGHAPAARHARRGWTCRGWACPGSGWGGATPASGCVGSVLVATSVPSPGTKTPPIGTSPPLIGLALGLPPGVIAGVSVQFLVTKLQVDDEPSG